MEFNGKAETDRLPEHGPYAHFLIEISRQPLLRKILTQLLILIFCINLFGCISFYSYHPVRFSLRDAETDEPISGAILTLQCTYAFAAPINRPKDESARTDAGGHAEIRVASTGGHYWTLAAEGYIPPDYQTLDEAIPDGLTKYAEIRLYRNPGPTVKISVPNGYIGPLVIERSPSNDWIQERVGKRDFMYHASSNGFVHIDATPLLIRIDRYMFTVAAQYENGEPIPRGQDCGQDLAIWQVADSNDDPHSQLPHRALFVIGTKRDQQILRARMKPVAFALDQKMFDSYFPSAAMTQPATQRP